MGISKKLHLLPQATYAILQQTTAASGRFILWSLGGAIAACSFSCTASEAIPTKEDLAIPKYDHIFVIIEENKSYEQIIGPSYTPNINRLAKANGLATRFYGNVHPSEGNYAALLGGSTFGIHDDDAYYCKPKDTRPFCFHADQPEYTDHTVTTPSLLDQLAATGRTWKGYFESLPKDVKTVYSPALPPKAEPESTNALYASKHNGFMNFKVAQDDPDLAKKVVGIEQLDADLASGKLPNYSHIVPNQCNEMHGLVPGSVKGCDGGMGATNDVDPNNQQLLKTGDAVVAALVNKITKAPFWLKGNNAIVITFDEDNFVPPFDQGCCGHEPKSKANFGGGHIATVVITSHGRRRVIDNTPYNHYSLLRTVEDAFRLYDPSTYRSGTQKLAGYLNHADDTAAGVKPMTRLFIAP
jgi:phosphatidylinositol-3-phosphatase